MLIIIYLYILYIYYIYIPVSEEDPAETPKKEQRKTAEAVNYDVILENKVGVL